MKKVLITDSIAEQGIQILKREPDINVDLKLGLTSEELIKCIWEYDAIITRSGTKVTAEVIEAAKNLKVIGRAGVGADNIDIDAATRGGIVVMNSPTGNTISAAEHTMAMILALSRNIVQAGSQTKLGSWDRKKFIGVELYDKVLGVVGLGRIGTEVVKRAKTFGMRIFATDPYVSPEAVQKLEIKFTDLEEILKMSDYITVHVPLTPETHHLFSYREFEMMKEGVRVINCSRGGIFDEKVLYEAMVSGKVAGAALDVFENEPPLGNPLLMLENVICTPHLGASTEEAQVNISIEIANQTIEALKGNIVKNAINFPYMDARTLEVIGPYLSLIEKIGSLQAQLVDGNISHVSVLYSGEPLISQTALLTAALSKGLLTPALAETVNYINAPLLIKERGLKVTESKTNDHPDFSTLISVSVKTNKGEKTVEGTIFGKNDPRIISIDGYHIDATPSGYLIVLYNDDKPGAIGQLGTLLGKNKINIAGMYVGRNRPGGKAVMIVNVDDSVSREVMEQVSMLDQIQSAKLVKL